MHDMTDRQWGVSYSIATFTAITTITSAITSYPTCTVRFPSDPHLPRCYTPAKSTDTPVTLRIRQMYSTSTPYVAVRLLSSSTLLHSRYTANNRPARRIVGPFVHCVPRSTRTRYSADYSRCRVNLLLYVNVCAQLLAIYLPLLAYSMQLSQLFPDLDCDSGESLGWNLLFAS
ncbi:hypothetical protein J6590_062936 [Homalodisca vitripennis]|nr:hypothetical protein J6590_062936 [Homalodisca vitripennis]